VNGTGWPKGFTWGTSSSAYQIEGAWNEDGRGPSIWDTQSHTPERVANGDTGDVACDHYHRYPEDIALMRELGVDAYRYSTAWPRILPEGRGRVNPLGLDFYDRLTDAVLAAGIEPWICLYHWDLPQALQDAGGWANRDCAQWYADYARIVAQRLGDRVTHYATFNESSVFTMFAHVFDWHAPSLVSKELFLKAVHHVNLAHGLACDVLRAEVPGAQLGAVHNAVPILPETETDADRAACALLNEHWNLAFPDPQILGAYPPALAADIAPYVKSGDMAQIQRPVDWFGLNHYGPIFCKHSDEMIYGYAWGDSPEGLPNAEVGWALFPEMFTTTLLELTERYHVPLYVAENGCGTGNGSDVPDESGKADDWHRSEYLRQYTGAALDAIRQGADLRGYFVWSLMDNFEWGLGYMQRYGLVHVDFETLKRTPKESFHWYKRLIASSRA